MPQYVFERVDKPSVTQDLFYHMDSVPSVGKVVTIDGVQWKRIFTRMQASFDTHTDCHSAKDYLKATNKNDSVGALFDRAKEMSLKRIDKDGVDNVKEGFFREYTKKRGGNRMHPEQRRAEGVKALAKKGIRLDYGSDD